VGRDDTQDEGISQLREELDARIQAERATSGAVAGAMTAQPAPAGTPHIRATMDYGSSGALGGSNTYMEMLMQRRDAQAAQRTPRSAASWSAEQKRPGSWQSGVGGFVPVGQGRQITIGVGRPLIQQRDS